MLNNKKEYIERLKAMDWFFDYSDDYRVWEKYAKEIVDLSTYALEHDAEYKLWNKYCDNKQYKKTQGVNYI